MTQLVDAIHIGFPKTGTSWLQIEVIGRMPHLVSLGKPYLVDLGYRDVLNDLVSCNEYDFRSEKFRSRFAELNRKNKAAMSGGEVRLISFERLSGELFSGLDSKQLLDRVHKIFGSTTIIITIREQASIVESVYRHYVKGGGPMHIREFMYKNRSPSVDLFNNLHMLHKFRYDKIINHCRDLFGQENVKILVFESMLKDGPAAFARQFAAALRLESTPDPAGFGQRHNESLSYLGSGMLRAVNQIVSTPHSDSPFLRLAGQNYNSVIFRPMRQIDQALISHISPHKRFIDKKRKWWSLRLAKRVLGRYDAANDEYTIADDIRRAYAPSNRATSELIGIDLAGYGYAT